jgi:protein involved in polysaccharide export with SLBB domain
MSPPISNTAGHPGRIYLVRFETVAAIKGCRVTQMRLVPKKQRSGRLAIKFSAFAVLLGFSLLAWGCGGDEILQPTAEDQQAILTAAAAPHHLQTGEKIRVTVYGEQGLSGEYEIDPSGSVSLPLAGTVQAAGLTQKELEQRLTQQFSSEYLKNPKVTVSIIEFRPFYILGEVQKPGAYPYTGGLNVLSAIAIAGGTTYRANRSKIYIQHAGENGLQEYIASAAIPVMPGDVIQIPRRYF